MREKIPQKIQREIFSTAKYRCELCGDVRNLEIHHIIPFACGGDNDINNLVLLCSRCHYRLTPKGYLTKMGQKKNRWSSPVKELAFNFYKHINEILEGTESVGDYCRISVGEILDIFDSEVNGMLGTEE